MHTRLHWTTLVLWAGAIAAVWAYFLQVGARGALDSAVVLSALVAGGALYLLGRARLKERFSLSAGLALGVGVGLFGLGMARVLLGAHTGLAAELEAVLAAYGLYLPLIPVVTTEMTGLAYWVLAAFHLLLLRPVRVRGPDPEAGMPTGPLTLGARP